MYDRYELAVSGAELGLWDWDLKTNEVYFSKEWKKMLGYEEDEIPNRLEFWDENVHPLDKEKAYEDILNNQNKNIQTYENIHRLKHKDGSWVWILDKGRTIFDKDGIAIRMLGFHTNITKIQNLKMELSKLKKVIEHSPISIVITDVNGKIEYVNPHFCQITGYTINEAIGVNPRVLKSEYTSIMEYKDLWETITNKKTWVGRFKNKSKNGREFWESAIITPILNDSNEITNYLAIKQEITKEIYLKEEIKNKEEMMIAQSRHAAMGEMRNHLMTNFNGFDIFSVPIVPYKWLNEFTAAGKYTTQYNQEGLGIRTYKSDIFNNWLNEEQINAINETSAIAVINDKITIDQIILQKKVYELLNRISVSGGTYQD